MSSRFVGVQVELTLHSQPNTIKAKILSIDQASNTLTIQKDDGSRSCLKRSDIARLAAYTPSTNDSPKLEPAHLVPGQVSRSSRTALQTSIPASLPPKPKNSPIPTPALVDPAIMSLTRTDVVSTTVSPASPAPASQHDVSQSQHVQRAVDHPSRSSTPSRSPRPKSAAVIGKQSKKKPSAISRGSSPAISSERMLPPSSNGDFDFGAGLAAFDKKRIWDEIRSSDQTDPASLLVSHNRISNGPTPLVRGPNGVGPANATPAPHESRGRATPRDGQQKLRPNEMVCSPSPERRPSPPVKGKTPPVEQTMRDSAVTWSTTGTTATGIATEPAKQSYEDLKKRIRQLEAELAIAHRRNVLLEELVGLGRSANSGWKASAGAAQIPEVDNTTPQTETMSPASCTTANNEGELSLSHKIQHLTFQNAPTELAVPSFDRQETTVAEHEPVIDTASSPSISVNVGARPTVQAPFFGHVIDKPVVTLLFPTAAIQHASLARMEAFYESDSSSKRYLNLIEARDERICRNYQGFNFPIEQGVKQWLAAMWAATEERSSHVSSTYWWYSQCSDEENTFLNLLVEIGAISESEAHLGTTSVAQDDSVITYVISSIASQANSTLPHELLHALYFLAPSYRTFVSTQWKSLSAPIKKVIETDLSMRKYSPSVYEDEFQAYLAEGTATEKEFGNKPASECKHIAQQLRKQAEIEWQQLGYSPQGKESLWEDAKWDTLDRYAAHQKELRKTASAKKSKR